MKHDVTNRTNTLTYKAERRLNNTKVRLVAALVMALPLMVSSTGYAAEPPAATSLTAAQQAVYNAVLQELAKKGVHYVSVNSTNKGNDSNFNNDGAKKDGGIAIGDKAKSENWDAIAIGSGSNSAGGWGMAIGVEAQNTAQLGMAIGHKTKVTAANGLALGVQASTSGEDAISIGTCASSSAMRGIAVGTNSNVAATAARGIAIGDGAYVGAVNDKHKGTAMPKPGDEWTPSMPFQPTDDDTKPGKDKTPQENSLAIGMRASAFGFQNVAIGAAAEAHDTNSTVVGVAAVAKGHYSTALGKQARTYGQETTSVGHWADTRDEFATALGAKSIAYKKGATALGSNARAYDENSVAIGANSIAKEAVDGNAVYTNEEVKAAAGIVSVGHPDYKVGDKEVKANYRRIVNVAGGILDHDAVNVAQLKAVANMVTNGAVHYISVNGESQDADSNYKNDGAKGKGAVAIGEKALAAKGGTVSIGRNAQILGNGGNTDGEGSVAIGDNTLITTNGLDLASIAIGKHAKVLNGSGKQERGLSFTPDNFDKPGWFGSGDTLPKHPDKVPGGIAIGTNTFARTGSIQIGAHTFAGHQMGGIDITESMTKSTEDTNEQANIVGMTTIGTNTYNKGALANMYGAYSVITGDFTGEGGTNSWDYGPQNFGANVVGSLNSIRSKGHNGSSGVANSIVGVANTVENANGTLVYGAGNKITNSNKYISAPGGFTTLNTWEDTVTALQKSIKDSNSGGAVLAIGGGNVADYVRHSQLVGVNNTVIGTENKVSEYNMVDGYKNTVTNGTHVTMIGSENTATNSESTLVMGDKQKVTKVKHGVLLGSQDKETETTVADVVAIGHNAHVEKEGGVALGSGAIAKRDKGAFGYDVATGKVLDEAGAAAALGNSAALKPLAEKYTAAKAAYEEAKKAVDTKQQEVTAIEKVCGKMCIAGENAEKKSKLKHELNKLKTTLRDKQKAYEESQTAINNSLYPWKSTAAAVSVGDAEKGITRQITGVAAGTEDTDAVNVAQLKRNRVHYMAVNGTAQDAVSNYNNDGAKQAGGIAIGESAKSDAVGGIAIGRGVDIWYSGGVPTQASGDIAIGDKAHINNYINQGGSVTIGSHAFSENMTGGEEWDVNFSQTEYVPNNTWLGVHEPKDPSKVIGSMAIGQNAYSRTGSTMVGMHNYTGKVGDLEVSNDIKMENLNVYSTTVGSNSYNNGAFATVYGAYSTISSNYDGDKRNNLAQSLGATITGSLNSIEAKTGSDYAGIGNSITGMANRTVNANGALIYGAGNMIQNSWDTIHVGSENSTSAEDFQAKLVAQRKSTASGDSAKGMQEVLMDSVKKSANGGAVIAIGGGNTANYVRHSQLVGVNNTVTGTENTVSEFNTIDGYQNTVTNGKHVTMIGSGNTATDSESTLVMGDKQKVTKVKHGVLLGSQDTETETTVADVVAIGHNAYVKKEGGIALGSYSIASIDKGIIGYDPLTGKASTETSAIWKATQAALSVGSTEDKNNLITRQITGVAAGTEDTDAVNVAQLKKVAEKIKDVADNAGSKVDIKGGDTGITVTPKKDDKTGITTYTVGLGNTIKAGNVTINGEASADNGKDGKGTITGLSNTTWDGTNIVSGRAATEDQLKAAVEKVVSGSAKQTTVTKGTNIVVTEGSNTAGGKDYTVALDKNLTGLESATFTKTENGVTTTTAINNKGVTVGTGDKVLAITENSITFAVPTTPTGEKGKALTIDGTTGTITGLTNTTWDGKAFVSGRAATEDQLKQVVDTVNSNATAATDFRLVKAGTTKDVDGTGDYTVSKDGKITLTVQDKNHKDQLQEIGITDVARKSDVDKMLKEGFTVGEAGKPGKDGTDGKVEVIGKDGSAVVIKGEDGSIGLKGKDGKDGVGINGKDGGSITIHGTNGADGKDGQNGVTIRGIDGKNGEKGEKGVDGTTTINRIVTVDPNGTTHQVATMDDGLKFAGDSGDAIAKKLNETVTISGGVAEEKQLTDKNIGVVAKDGKLNVKLVKNLTGLESATFTKTVKNGDKEETTSTVINDLGTTVTDKDGNKTVTTAAGITITTKKDGKENTVSLKNDGLHNGDHKILGVADGRIAAQSRDAVNGGQVYRMMQEAAAATDGKVGAAAAGSAALAALHPLDFDPDAKWNVAASYGTYGHYQAYALGAYYRPSESSMVSVGGTIGSGADAMNVGLSFKVGKGNLNHISTLRMAMAKEIQELQRKNEVMRKQNEAANDRIAQLEQRLAALEARLK